MSEKSKIRKAVDSLIEGVIIFLEGERKYEERRPLYTREELDELYGIKKDIQRFPKHG